MKYVPLLLVIAALAVSGCTTLSNRRDQYAPKKGSGYWTTQYEERAGRPVRQVAKPGPESGIFGYSHPAYQ